MRLRLFLLSSVWDFLLVMVIAMGLSFAVLSGFDGTLSLRTAFGAQLAVLGPAVVLLFAGSWSKRALLPAAMGFLLFCGIALGVAAACTPADVPWFVEGTVNDAEGNFGLFCVVVIVCGALAYFLSRRPAGAVGLLVAVVVVCGAVQFLYRDWLASEGGLVGFVALICACGAMVMYQRYRVRAARADVLVNPAFTMAFVQAVAIAGLCVGGSWLVWAAVIEPMELTTPMIKPFERTIARPVVEYTGTYDEMAVEDPNNRSDQTNNDQNETQQNGEGGSEADQQQELSSNPLISWVQSLAVFSPDSAEESMDPVSHGLLQVRWLMLVLVLIVISCLIGARLAWRWRRLRVWRSMLLDERIGNAYRFFLDRFGKLGFGKPPSATPLEYAFDRQRDLIPFTKGTGEVDFVTVTLLYQRAAYGSALATEDDWLLIERYYRRFFPNAREQAGLLRWLIQFWRI